MVDLILLGGGGHCKSVIEVIRQLPEYSIVGILDPSFDPMKKQEILNVPIIGDDDEIPNQIALGRQFVITVGQIKKPTIRKKLFELVKSLGGQLPTLKAKTAYVAASSSLGEGIVLMNNAMVNCDVQIGDCTIINTGALLEHDVRIGDFCHVAPGTVIAGDVKIWDQSFIGANSVLVQGVEVGEESVIGAGSVVLKEVPPKQVWVGNPAQRIS